MKIKLHENFKGYRKYAIIITYEDNNLLLVRHRDRDTWEIPGGHHEAGEDISDTARRELYEETGAMDYHLEHLCDYSVGAGEDINYGSLFMADVYERGPLPPLEIVQVEAFTSLPPKEEMTYGEIQHRLIDLLEEGGYLDKR